MNSLLAGIRVLDLTSENGFLCGRILAELGADVIKVEKPGGDASRNIGPFYHDVPDPEKSLTWFAYNFNKRGITLDINTRDGQEIFKQLVKKAGIVIESFPVGYMHQIGLDYPKLKEINPGIIMTCITPFGQTGPYSEFVASDLIIQAMSGYLYVCGDPDRPPLRVSIPQAPLHAGGEAAVATLIALYYKKFSGKGQCVDVSAQHSMVRNTVNAVPVWLTYGKILERSGAFRVGLGNDMRARQTWACKDGFVNFVFFGGMAAFSIGGKNLAAWLEEEDLSTEHFRSIDWNNFDIYKYSQDEWAQQIEAPIARLFLKHTKQELLSEGTKRRTPIFPVSSPEEIVANQHLKARDFWVDVEHPELGSQIKYPGSCIRFAEGPPPELRRAPLIGEHNLDIYHHELGLSLEELVELKQAKII